MSSTKKGNDWYFGMKVHIGVDTDSGVTHSLDISTAKLHDSQVWDKLLHSEETSVRTNSQNSFWKHPLDMQNDQLQRNF